MSHVEPEEQRDDDEPEKGPSRSRELRGLESDLLDASAKRKREDDKEMEPEKRGGRSRELRGLESDLVDKAKKLPSMRAQAKKRRSKRVSEKKSQRGLRTREADDFDRSAPVPVKHRTGIFTGKNRPDYLDGTKDSVLAQMPSQLAGLQTLYECPGWKQKPAHWVTADEVTIDHEKGWLEWIYDTAKPEEDGTITNKSAQEAYSDLRNLQGLCGPCNSSKNGKKGVF
ncbi:MAG TPA: GH-E family nuclease [Streptosporangiaceae bacterium]